MSLKASQPSVYFATLYAESLLHGIYTVLFGLAVYAIVRGKVSLPSNANLDFPSKKSKRRLEWKGFWLMMVTIAMFCVATIHSAIGLRQAFSELVVEDGVVIFNNSPASPWEYTKLALEVVNCVLGDVIVLWRVLKIGFPLGVNYLALCSLLCLFAGSAVAGIGMVFTASRTISSDDIVHEPLNAWIIAWSSLTLATNVFATAIIFRTWFGTAHGVADKKPLHHQILATMIESGCFYSCTFALFLVLFGLGLDASYILNHVVPQLAGIYPTLIIVLVCWHSHNYHLSSTANPRALPSPLFATPKTSRRDTKDFGALVVDVHHEQVTDSGCTRTSMDTKAGSLTPTTLWTRYDVEQGDVDESYIGRAQ
ncbi:hypothetical protein OF83DRAFT_1169408 [Amylostereum chailletii]|nr:hypothetical protein OF83DRAFT_1169408 [Amylostereum chailletii]